MKQGKKTVLVTGGTIRLGKVIADRLRADGWRVLTTSHRSRARADIVADFTTQGGADYCFDEACRLLGGEKPDALVNNAALFTGGDEDLRRINERSPMRLVERMAKRRCGMRGAVVNVLDSRILTTKSSVDSSEETIYEKSKRALMDATQAAAKDFARTLRVNAVAPGPVLSPVSVRERAGRTLVGRPTPEDVAVAVAFLLSTPSITGAVIPVDGGQHLI